MNYNTKQGPNKKNPQVITCNQGYPIQGTLWLWQILSKQVKASVGFHFEYNVKVTSEISDVLVIGH